MGRRTWEDDAPDKDQFVRTRIVVVISRNPIYVVPGAHVCRSYDEAISLLATKPLADQVSRIWNVGGAEIGRLGMKHPTFRRLYLTHIFEQFDCDTFFPDDIDLTSLRRVSDPDVPAGIQEDGGIKWEVRVYENTLQ